MAERPMKGFQVRVGGFDGNKIEFVIKNIPDDQLFAEVRRQGSRLI
jgi:hypothetical protein